MAAIANETAPTGLVELILLEGPIGMAGAARLLGTFRRGKPTNPGTVARWATVGTKLAGGRTLRLETIRLNGRLVTSKPALIRFIERQKEQPSGDPAASAVRSPSAFKSAASRAGDELERMGA